MEGTINDTPSLCQTIRSMREENLALRRRIAELEQIGRFHAVSINRLVDEVIRLNGEVRNQAESTQPVHPILVEASQATKSWGLLALLSPINEIVLYPGREIVRIARRHRSIFAPHGSGREQIARKIMKMQRRVRGIAASP